MTIAPSKIASWLGLGFGLGLVLELGDNFSRGQLSENLLLHFKFFLQLFTIFKFEGGQDTVVWFLWSDLIQL